MDDERVSFLIKAKRATYAGGGGETASSRPRSRDLRFAEGRFEYIDTYLGGERFVGEEALWEDGTPVWAMNYSGRVTGEGFSGGFLKAALSLVPKDAPFRGPREYADGGFVYRCRANGGFEWFDGGETISRDGVEIYECVFHGGLVL